MFTYKLTGKINIEEEVKGFEQVGSWLLKIDDIENSSISMHKESGVVVHVNAQKKIDEWINKGWIVNTKDKEVK